MDTYIPTESPPMPRSSLTEPLDQETTSVSKTKLDLLGCIKSSLFDDYQYFPHHREDQRSFERTIETINITGTKSVNDLLSPSSSTGRRKNKPMRLSTSGETKTGVGRRRNSIEEKLKRLTAAMMDSIGEPCIMATSTVPSDASEFLHAGFDEDHGFGQRCREKPTRTRINRSKHGGDNNWDTGCNTVPLVSHPVSEPLIVGFGTDGNFEKGSRTERGSSPATVSRQATGSCKSYGINQSSSRSDNDHVISGVTAPSAWGVSKLPLVGFEKERHDLAGMDQSEEGFNEELKPLQLSVSLEDTGVITSDWQSDRRGNNDRVAACVSTSSASCGASEPLLVSYADQSDGDGHDDTGSAEGMVEDGEFSLDGVPINAVGTKALHGINHSHSTADSVVTALSSSEREATVVDFKPQEDEEERTSSNEKFRRSLGKEDDFDMTSSNNSRSSSRVVSHNMLSHIPTIDGNTSLNMSARMDTDLIYDEEEGLKFEQHLRRTMHRVDWKPLARHDSDSPLLPGRLSTRAYSSLSSTTNALLLATNQEVNEAQMRWRNGMFRDRHLEQDLVNEFRLLNRPENSFENPLQVPTPDWSEGRCVLTTAGNKTNSAAHIGADHDDDMTVMSTATSMASVLTMPSVVAAWTRKIRGGRSSQKVERVGRRFLDLTVDAHEAEDWYNSGEATAYTRNSSEDYDDEVSLVSTYSISFRKKRGNMKQRQQEMKRTRSIARNFLDLTTQSASLDDGGWTSLTHRESFCGSLFGATRRSVENRSPMLLLLKDFDELDLSQTSDNIMDFQQNEEDEKTAITATSDQGKDTENC